MLDLDGFKEINDTLGHLTGDEVLKNVAQALSRPAATVGRFGGDEFLALIEGPLPQARLFAKQVGDRLATFRSDRRDLPVQASFGFACHPTDAITAADLIRLADLEMYSSRRARQAERRAQAV